MRPLTPKTRQALIRWIAGLCDGENYGRFLAYKFPKERRVLGPQQVEVVQDPDRILEKATAEVLVASADSRIMEGAQRTWQLARAAVERIRPAPGIVDLSAH